MFEQKVTDDINEADREENHEALNEITNEIEDRQIATGNASEDAEYHDFFEELKEDIRNKRAKDKNLGMIK